MISSVEVGSEACSEAAGLPGRLLATGRKLECSVFCMLFAIFAMAQGRDQRLAGPLRRRAGPLRLLPSLE